MSWTESNGDDNKEMRVQTIKSCNAFQCIETRGGINRVQEKKGGEKRAERELSGNITRSSSRQSKRTCFHRRKLVTQVSGHFGNVLL